MVLALAAILAATPLKVGVTLHPYYAWTRALAQGLPLTVVPLLPADVDAGGYQPRPEDLVKFAGLDAVVINGLGHDDFVPAMAKASGNERLKFLRPNTGIPLVPNFRGEGKNPHTFLSFSLAILQVQTLARQLSELRPEWAETLGKNAASYVARLKKLRHEALLALAQAPSRRVITVHDGYTYLLRELKVTLVDVVEPAHGLVPSAQEMGSLLARARQEKVTVVLAEASFPQGLLRVLTDAGIRAEVISHVATGDYTDECFETDMKANVEALVRALVPVSK